jgi:hypothetical protein
VVRASSEGRRSHRRRRRSSQLSLEQSVPPPVAVSPFSRPFLPQRTAARTCCLRCSVTWLARSGAGKPWLRAVARCRSNHLIAACRGADGMRRSFALGVCGPASCCLEGSERASHGRQRFDWTCDAIVWRPWWLRRTPGRSDERCGACRHGTPTAASSKPEFGRGRCIRGMAEYKRPLASSCSPCT